VGGSVCPAFFSLPPRTQLHSPQGQRSFARIEDTSEKTPEAAVCLIWKNISIILGKLLRFPCNGCIIERAGAKICVDGDFAGVFAGISQD
jgi:hypothetical protein